MAYFGESVHIVNPAYETAMDLKKILEEQKIANTSGEPAAYDFYVSDAAEKFKKFANSILPYDVDRHRQLILKIIRRIYDKRRIIKYIRSASGCDRD